MAHPAANARDLTLDAWRGLSVLLVVISHLASFRYPNNTLVDATPLVVLLDHGGTLGVKFFFVISGYIITKLLLLEHRRTGSICLPAFFIRRAFRILPALWLYLLITFLLTCCGLIAHAGSFLTAVSFLCNTGAGSCGWFITHLWSLGVEEQFYLAWPAILFVTGCRSIPKLSLAMMLLFLALAQSSLLFMDWINNGLSFACIAAGALYATSEWLRASIERMATLKLLALAGVLLFARPLIPLLFPGQYRLHDVVTPVLICFVIFSTFRYRIYLEKQLLWRWLGRLGLVSYGTYLWQQLFLAPPDNYLIPSLLQVWPLFFPVALLSYFVLERPMMRVGSQLSKKYRAARANSARVVPEK